MKWSRLRLITIILLGIVLLFVWSLKSVNNYSEVEIGNPVDSLNGVLVFYNGAIGNVNGRSTTKDGYNLGLKYQCVEFVKRYYYEHLKHKMPNSYGHAKDFYNSNLIDGEYNSQRDLIQYQNQSQTRPQVNDLLIFKESMFNQYGHVAIVSEVANDYVEIIQQNPGPYSKSRVRLEIQETEGKWKYSNDRILGWLRKGE